MRVIPSWSPPLHMQIMPYTIGISHSLRTTCLSTLKNVLYGDHSVLSCLTVSVATSLLRPSQLKASQSVASRFCTSTVIPYTKLICHWELPLTQCTSLPIASLRPSLPATCCAHVLNPWDRLHRHCVISSGELTTPQCAILRLPLVQGGLDLPSQCIEALLHFRCLGALLCNGCICPSSQAFMVDPHHLALALERMGHFFCHMGSAVRDEHPLAWSTPLLNTPPGMVSPLHSQLRWMLAWWPPATVRHITAVCPALHSS